MSLFDDINGLIGSVGSAVGNVTEFVSAINGTSSSSSGGGGAIGTSAVQPPPPLDAILNAIQGLGGPVNTGPGLEIVIPKKDNTPLIIGGALVLFLVMRGR